MVYNAKKSTIEMYKNIKIYKFIQKIVRNYNIKEEYIIKDENIMNIFILSLLKKSMVLY
jgi:hypothetical protein